MSTSPSKITDASKNDATSLLRATYLVDWEVFPWDRYKMSGESRICSVHGRVVWEHPDNLSVEVDPRFLLWI